MNTKLDKSSNFIKSLDSFLSHLDLDIDITKQCSWIVSKQHNEQRDEPNFCDSKNPKELLKTIFLVHHWIQ